MIANMNTNNSNSNIPVPFRILEVSSEDSNHPITHLESRCHHNACDNGSANNDSNRSSISASITNNRNNENQGWQSKQNCTYPQYIILQPIRESNSCRSDNDDNTKFNNCSTTCSEDTLIHLTQMQILAHNQKIPTRIDIHVSKKRTIAQEDKNENDPSSPSVGKISNSITFERLGYVNFDDNSKTNYRARELKSISLDVKVTYVKLVIHTCHGNNKNVGDGKVNKDAASRTRNEKSMNEDSSTCIVNPFHQVGIVKIQLFGKGSTKIDNEEEQINHNHIHKKGGRIDDEYNNQNIIDENKIEKASIGINTTFAIEQKIVSPPKSSINSSKQKRNRGNRKRMSLNPHDLEDFKSRLALLEKKKLEMARSEDFDTAAKIKAIIVEISSIFTNFQRYQSEMRQAAENEDYVKASQLKSKRDKAYSNANNALNSAEKKVEDLSALNEDTTSPSSSSQSINEFKTLNRDLEDLSLSTIRRFDDDEPSVAMTMTGRSFQLNIDERPIVSRQTLCNQSKNEYSTIHEKNESLKDKLDESGTDHQEDGEHPLEGVPDYQNLPTPEELHDGEGGLAISLSSSSSIVSTDSILKIESVLGRYRTKCFLSKNWSLREAALLKLTLILPSVIEKYQADYPIEDDWVDTFFRRMVIILERAIEDKIVQVYLTGLILLDDCICHIEKFQLSQKEILSLLNSTVFSLVEKMTSSNQKVVEGAATALMSLSLFDGVGPTYIGSQLMKRSSSKGKLLSSKFRLLRDIIDEFDEEAPNGQKVMNFVKSNGFGHKDVDVREAAKELTIAVFLRDGNIVLSMLDGLSERQLKEYKLAFASAKQALSRSRDEEELREVNKETNTPEYNNAEINRLLTPNPQHTKQTVAPTPRGRGRGRGRRTASQGDRLGRMTS